MSTDIMDQVCARDRRWFEKHPRRCSYVRDYVPGELGEMVIIGPTIGVQVKVVKIGADVRARCFLDAGDDRN